MKLRKDFLLIIKKDHLFQDSFRGKYRGKNTTPKYVFEVKKQIELIHSKNKRLGGIIIEPIISCGGQIELPASDSKIK